MAAEGVEREEKVATEGVEREEKVAAEEGVQRKGGCSRDREGGKSEIQKMKI